MLKQNIQTATTVAMKGGDSFVVGVLRMLLASIISKEKEKRYKLSKDPAFAKATAGAESLDKESQLTDEQILEVISSEIKKRKDAIILYEKGNRPELADKEKKEIEVLIKYLPEQLSEDEIKKIVAEAIEKVMSALGGSALGGKDMGKVMAEISPKIKGKADSGAVSNIVKELLATK